jgi:hypothetical protein
LSSASRACIARGARQRLRGVIGARDRGAEHREDAVAEQLEHAAAVVVDQRGHLVEVAVDDRDHLAGARCSTIVE